MNSFFCHYLNKIDRHIDDKYLKTRKYHNLQLDSGIQI